jgi:hypothetical protein
VRFVSRPEFGVFFCDPSDELFDFRMCFESLNRVVMLQQFPFCEDRMDLGMANGMNEDGICALECLGDKVVGIDGPPFYEISSADGAFSEETGK